MFNVKLKDYYYVYRCTDVRVKNIGIVIYNSLLSNQCRKYIKLFIVKVPVVFLNQPIREQYRKLVSQVTNTRMTN